MFDNITMRLNVEPLLLLALKEDINAGDLSASAVIPPSDSGRCSLICKEDGILCGLDIFKRVFTLLDESITFHTFASEGEAIYKGQKITDIEGNMASILSAERTALNYLQRMSGIATYTNKMTALLEGSHIKLVDTRKTTPNNRIFEKYAVKTGGACNHRFNLSTGVMLKDNHISAAGSIKKAVELTRNSIPFVHKIEVEVENIDMVKEAVSAGADVIMLDNMSISDMKKAIKLIDSRAEIEISGNVNEKTLPKLKELGADYITIGALTHSAPILDFSLKNLVPIK